MLEATVDVDFVVPQDYVVAQHKSSIQFFEGVTNCLPALLHKSLTELYDEYDSLTFSYLAHLIEHTVNPECGRISLYTKHQDALEILTTSFTQSWFDLSNA